MKSGLNRLFLALAAVLLVLTGIAAAKDSSDRHYLAIQEQYKRDYPDSKFDVAAQQLFPTFPDDSSGTAAASPTPPGGGVVVSGLASVFAEGSGTPSTLPSGPNPSSQLLSDLNELNATECFADGRIPLRTWLANAAHLASPRLSDQNGWKIPFASAVNPM